MPSFVVRYETKPDRADENQQLVERVYEELAKTAPAGFRYATFRLADGVTFVHVSTLDTADGANPLTTLPAFADFQADIADRCAIPPAASDATVVGSYRMVSD